MTAMHERTFDPAWLDITEGWLNPAEARCLFDAAIAVRPSDPDPLIVEIGSYKGLSATVLARACAARGAGRVLAIDPFDKVPGQAEAFDRAIREAGVDDLVTAITSTSQAARHHCADGSISVLFVDGSHDYDDVVADIRDWTPALADHAVVAFNDPFWPGVGRALRDVEGNRSSPYRHPRWVDSTLFFDYLPTEPWRFTDTVALARLRAFLRLGRWWRRFHHWFCALANVPPGLKRLQLRAARLGFRLLLTPAAPPSPIVDATPELNRQLRPR